jgi:hypothetical protein
MLVGHLSPQYTLAGAASPELIAQPVWTFPIVEKYCRELSQDCIPMRKLSEVEEAKALMTEAVEWSVMRWLREKKRVRKAADKANDALDALEQEIKREWSAELTAAYGELLPASSKQPRVKKDNDSISAEIRLAARQIKLADEQAYRAHMDAEETFDEAEKQLSTRLAREGATKAIASWELHEAAIRKAEAAVQKR